MTDDHTKDTERATLRGLARMVSKLRDLDGEMPIQQLAVLLWVALNEGKQQSALCKDLDMPTSSSSRNIAALSRVHRLGKEGLGLITWVDHPEDRRSKMLMLSQKGRTFVQGMLETL